jgi:hypothetical protein
MLGLLVIELLVIFKNYNFKHHYDTCFDHLCIELELVFTIWQPSLGVEFGGNFVIIYAVFLSNFKGVVCKFMLRLFFRMQKPYWVPNYKNHSISL